jgi:hypothetical protein
MQPQLDASDDPEAATSAPERPEQVGMLCLAGMHLRAVGQHDIGAKKIIDGHAEAARKEAHPAAQGETNDARRRVGPGRRGQADRLRGPVEVRPGCPGADASDLCIRVDLDVVHRRQVDHHAAVTHGPAGDAVPASPDGDRQTLAAGVGERFDDVGCAGALDDHRRTTIDHAVPDPSSGVVLLVGREDHPPVDPIGEIRLG